MNQLNSLAEALDTATTGIEFPREKVAVRHFLAVFNVDGSREAVLYEQHASGDRHFLMRTLRVRPQFNLQTVPGKDRGRPEEVHRRRIGRFTFLAQNDDHPLSVPEDVAIANAMVWRHLNDEEAIEKLRKQDLVAWEQVFREIYPSSCRRARRG
jgi:hypothetical protein